MGRIDFMQIRQSEGIRHVPEGAEQPLGSDIGGGKKEDGGPGRYMESNGATGGGASKVRPPLNRYIIETNAEQECEPGS